MNIIEALKAAGDYGLTVQFQDWSCEDDQIHALVICHGSDKDGHQPAFVCYLEDGKVNPDGEWTIDGYPVPAPEWAASAVALAKTISEAS